MKGVTKMKKILVSTLIVVCIGLIACGGADNTPAEQPQGGAPGTQAQETSVTSEPGRVHAVGETARIGIWEVTLESVDVRDSLERDDFTYIAPDGYVYFHIWASVKNVGTAGAVFLETIPFQAHHINENMVYNDTDFFGRPILRYPALLDGRTVTNPQEVTEGAVVFQLPERVINSTEPLVINFFNSTETITFNAR